MSRLPGVFAACAALLLLSGCGSEPPAAAATPQAPQASKAVDTNFLIAATKNGLAQKDFAKLAQKKATEASLRKFATETLQNQDEIDKHLAQFAQTKGVSLPYAMDVQHQRFYHQLESLNGYTFDRAYVERQLQNQTMAIQAFQTEADSGKDPAMRSYAKQQLPVMQDDLRRFLTSGGIQPALPGAG